MNAQFKAVGAIALAAWIGLYPHDSEGKDTFTSREFLTWKRESQDYYFRTSIGMAGMIASFTDKRHARCIEDWYFKDAAGSGDQILSAMNQHPSYHPRGIIVAMLQKVCGPFAGK